MDDQARRDAEADAATLRLMLRDLGVDEEVRHVKWLVYAAERHGNDVRNMLSKPWPGRKAEEHLSGWIERSLARAAANNALHAVPGLRG